MKLRYIFLSALAIAIACEARTPLPSSAAVFTECNDDTTVNIAHPGHIVIEESARGLKVTDGKPNSKPLFEQKYTNNVTSIASRTYYSNKKCTVEGDGLNITLKEKNDTKWSLVTGGLGLGLNSAIGQPKDAHLNMGKSFEVSWLKVIAAEYKWKQSAISFGLGLDWKNFKMTGEPYMMSKSEMGGIILTDYPANATALNSTLKIFSLQVPVLYSIKVNSIYTKFVVGPILNFNTYSSLKTNYITADGNNLTEFSKKLGQRPVTFDLFGAASWDCVGLYLKYSPVKAMKSSSELNFTPITVGIILFL